MPSQSPARGRRHSRGQAAVEFSVVGMLLLLISVGAYDLGRVYSAVMAVSGDARAGMRVGIQPFTAPNQQCGTGGQCTPQSDVGAAVRNEDPVSTLNWGLLGTSGGTDDQCGSVTGGPCGDQAAAPCTSSSDWWNSGTGVNACWAVGTCTYASGSCSSVAWHTRPSCSYSAPPYTQCWQQSSVALVVRVTYKYMLNTPFMSAIVGNGGVLYLSRDVVGIPLY